MIERFEELRINLFRMAELALSQCISLSDVIEDRNMKLCSQIIADDDQMDSLELENDSLSEQAVLAAIHSQVDSASKSEIGKLTRWHPLSFGLGAIRMTRHFERIGDQVVNCAKSFAHDKVDARHFTSESHLSLILRRVISIVGNVVELLLEEKTDFIGDIHAIEDEIDSLCDRFYHEIIDDSSIDKVEFGDLYRILLSLERIADLSVNVAEEIYRLNTGKDIRHSDNALKKKHLI